MTPTDPRTAARDYLARGWAPLPLPRRRKRPEIPDWPNFTLDADAVDRAFAPDGNVGLLLGARSAGLVDVDLDSPEAVAAAPFLLPPTGMMTGREGGPPSHYWYVVENPPAKAAEDFDDPTRPEADRYRHLLELRSTGGQTVVPPSVYPADERKGRLTEERCVWHKNGDPGEVDPDALRAAVRAVAAAALVARFWPTGGRNKAACALAGGLLRAGWTVDRAEPFVRGVCAAARDDEVQNRVDAVAYTSKRLGGNEPASGWPTLAGLIGTAGEAVVAKARQWLGVSVWVPDGPKPGPKTGPAGPRYTPLPPWRPFPVDHLPGALRDFALGVSAAMRCDPAYACLPALAVCAGMIGNTRVVALKRSWAEPAMLWTAVVGESGTMKTPPFKAALAPVVRMQRAHFKTHQAALRQYQLDLRAYEREKRRDKDQDPGDPPEQPPCTRVYARDVTIEALAGILDENRARFLIGRDELNGWLASFNQYKSKGGSDQANWLELHHRGTLSYDRKTGDKRTIFVEGIGVSICGGIQPGVLRDALSPQHFSAGVPARLLFAYPPRLPKQWTEGEVDEAVEGAYHKLAAGLAGLLPHTDDDGEPYPVTLQLTPEAKAVWVEFYNHFGRRQNETEGDLAAAFSKLEGYAARLALVHHVCRSVTAGEVALEPVGVCSVTAGIALARWFCYETERLYQMLGEDAGEQDVRKLVETVRRIAGRNGGRVTAKLLQKSNGRKYRSADLATLALDRLVGMGMGQWEERPTGPAGGRPTRDFIPCPTIDETDETPSADDRDSDDESGDDTGFGATNAPGTPSHQDVLNYLPEIICVNLPLDGVGVASVSPVVGRNNQERRHDSEQSAPPDGVSSAPSGGVVAGGWGHTSPDGYTLVTSAEGLVMVVAAVEDGGPVGLDCETSGLDHATDRVRLLSLATPRGTFLVDLSSADVAEHLPGVFDALAAVEVVGHNLGFDLPFLMRLGFAPARVRDTMLASQVLAAGDVTVRHGLKDVAARTLNVTPDKELQAADWTGPLTPDMLRYAALDAELPVRIWDELAAEVEAAGLTPTLAAESAALPCVAWAGRSGVGLDPAAWTALAAEADRRAAELRAKLDFDVPNPTNLLGVTNWDSPGQIQGVFGALGISLGSTDDDALAAVDHPVAGLLREYRSAAKRAGTYGRAWLERVGGGDRVYATWKPIGAGASGRMSCKGPNLQQLPRDRRYRECFVAPPGRVLAKCDYSQIELRIAAKLTGDKRMLAAYEAGEDLHTLTARALLGKTDVTRADRQLAKAVNFGLLYGQGANGLMRYALGSYGVTLTLDEAARHRETFFETYPGLRAWHRRVPDQPIATRTLAGRRRVNVTRYTEKLNTPVQGTGADGLKRALALLWERRGECPGAVPVLLVHDEVVVECGEDQADAAVAWVTAAMVDGMRPLIAPVPVAVEASVGRTWGG